MTAIGNDAATEITDTPLTETTATDEFLKRLEPPDAEKSSGSEGDTKTAANADEESAEPETKETEETSAEKPEGETETEETAAEEAARTYAEEGVYVKIKVGDEEHEVPVKDLQRLFGQEKALTQKSMEAAAQRKAADDELTKNTAATAALLERAEARFKPFSEIDFLLAAKELSAEDYTNLRTAATAAYEDVQFLKQNLNGFMQEVQTKQQGELVTQAKEAIKVLSGPTEKGGIEGWSEKLYDEIRGFAVTAGLDKEIVNKLVDPVAISLINDAMLFRRGKSKVVTTKVNKTPTKVVKTTTSPAVTQATTSKSDKKAAMTKLAKTGSQDDAANAFLAGWKDKDSED